MIKEREREGETDGLPTLRKEGLSRRVPLWALGAEEKKKRWGGGGGNMMLLS